MCYLIKGSHPEEQDYVLILLLHLHGTLLAKYFNHYCSARLNQSGFTQNHKIEVCYCEHSRPLCHAIEVQIVHKMIALVTYASDLKFFGKHLQIHVEAYSLSLRLLQNISKIPSFKLAQECLPSVQECDLDGVSTDRISSGVKDRDLPPSIASVRLQADHLVSDLKNETKLQFRACLLLIESKKNHGNRVVVSGEQALNIYSVKLRWNACLRTKTCLCFQASLLPFLV